MSEAVAMVFAEREDELTDMDGYSAKCRASNQSGYSAVVSATRYQDIETIEVLKEMLASYDGTAIFVSHAREFGSSGNQGHAILD